MRRLTVLFILAATACGSPMYSVSTCSFTGQAGGCETGDAIGPASPTVVYHFSLVDPRNTMPGCSAELSLEVKGGKAHFHAKELAPSTCAQLGADIEGSADVRGSTVQDVYFPAQDYTFRFAVKEQ